MFAGFFVDGLGGNMLKIEGIEDSILHFYQSPCSEEASMGYPRVLNLHHPNESCKTYPVTVDELTPTTEDQLTFKQIQPVIWKQSRSSSNWARRS